MSTYFTLVTCISVVEMFYSLTAKLGTLCNLGIYSINDMSIRTDCKIMDSLYFTYILLTTCQSDFFRRNLWNVLHVMTLCNNSLQQQENYYANLNFQSTFIWQRIFLLPILPHMMLVTDSARFVLTTATEATPNRLKLLIALFCLKVTPKVDL